MDALAYDLKHLAFGSADGSYSTQATRHRGLQAIARELKDLGYRLPGASSLKPKHIEALLTRWKTEGLTDGTLKNRMGWLRWWAQKVRKSAVMRPENEDYGIGQRERFNGNKAHRLDAERLGRVDDSLVRLSLQLQAAFGLRREEAIKFRVRHADRGDRIVLKPSWTKGGRYREIPLTHPRQRELLDEISAAVGDRALIPDGMSYRDQLQRYKHQTAKAGLGQGHGLRHAYAQWRYKVLTGRDCPARGGLTADALDPAERARDRWARETVSDELGHGRIDVTDAYLGRRFAAGARRHEG